MTQSLTRQPTNYQRKRNRLCTNPSFPECQHRNDIHTSAGCIHTARQTKPFTPNSFCPCTAYQ